MLSHHKAAEIRNSPLESGAKAILVKGKKGIWLLVMSASKQIDWKLVKKVVGRVEFVPLEEVPTITGCLSGAVPPFGSVLGESPIPTFMDVSLQEQGDIIYFNCVREESWCDLLGLENTYIKNEV